MVDHDGGWQGNPNDSVVTQFGSVLKARDALTDVHAVAGSLLTAAVTLGM